MSDNLHHPTAERLQELVEKALDDRQRAVVESHISVCAACRREVEELETLFGALSTLPAYAPSVGFADAVMARVRVRQPAFGAFGETLGAALGDALRPALAGAGRWIERITPKTTRGWAAAVAMLALPILGAALMVTWLMTQPGVTPQGLWTVTSDVVGGAVNSGWQWAWARFAGTTLAAWITQAVELAQGVGRGEIGLAAVAFATMTVGSTYVLYQNLFRPEARRTEHATYVF